MGDNARTTKASPDPPSSRSVLVYDGDCEFCNLQARHWQQRAGGGIECVPRQDPSLHARFPRLIPKRLAHAIHLIEPDGRVFRGAAAVFRLPGGGRAQQWLWRLYERSPGFAAAAEACYGWVARHRSALTALARVVRGKRGRPAPAHGRAPSSLFKS